MSLPIRDQDHSIRIGSSQDHRRPLNGSAQKETTVMKTVAVQQVVHPVATPVREQPTRPLSRPLDRPVSHQPTRPLDEPVREQPARPLSRPLDEPVREQPARPLSRPLDRPVSLQPTRPLDEPVRQHATRPLDAPLPHTREHRRPLSPDLLMQQQQQQQQQRVTRVGHPVWEGAAPRRGTNRYLPFVWIFRPMPTTSVEIATDSQRRRLNPISYRIALVAGVVLIGLGIAAKAAALVVIGGVLAGSALLSASYYAPRDDAMLVY